MDASSEDFFHDFRQELMALAVANSAFQVSEFMDLVTKELIASGYIEDFESCHYRAQRGLRVDGYWFEDEGSLDLFIADFESRSELASLTATEVATAFRRLTRFFEASVECDLYRELEETSPEYGLTRQIADRRGGIRKVRFFLLSERHLSDRLRAVEENQVAGFPATYHIWDISRLQRQRSSRGQKEPLDIDFKSMFGVGIPCLPAHVDSGAYESYLMVMPGDHLASLYDKYGARLLEQNVRSFLQARGKINKGIRTTLVKEPQMFFAYNNGVTATAQEVDTEVGDQGLVVTRIRDLQIVNGGQTTGSLFHTRRQDNVSLQGVFVQMKLSVIDGALSEEVVPKISEYANTQNRVNAADFFSNHPFHIRMEEASRRIWAPAQRGAQRETKWFYERARGQYADAQSKLVVSEQRGFLAMYPKSQLFTKTDLAKFENVWDEEPKWVNRGSQKNFARYAERIGKEWEKSPASFNDDYYHRAIARAIVFRRTEKLISDQRWYNGGYRANIVAYSLAALGDCAKRRNQAPDWERIWNAQAVFPSLGDALGVATEFVHSYISNPPANASNVSEWCKRDDCWSGLQAQLPKLEQLLSKTFFNDLESLSDQRDAVRQGRRAQRDNDGIRAQIQAMGVPAATWRTILEEGLKRKLLTVAEIECLRIAQRIPEIVPTPQQCAVLIEAYAKLSDDGLNLPRLP